jgi:hypothetical protein
LETKGQPWLEALIRLRKPIAVSLFVVCALLIVAGAFLGSKEDPNTQIGYSIDWDYWPEALGAIFLGLVFLGAGLWLRLASERDVHLTGVRILVLGVGGLVGLIVSLATVGRTIKWWNVIFTGGLEAWQGADGWRPWVCIAAGLAGLAVMLISLLLARTEERANPVLRRLLYGYNAALCGLLLLAILMVTNILVTIHFPTTYTWTETRGITDLSSKAKNILQSLKKDVQVYVIMAQGSRIYRQLETLLENSQAISDKVKVKTISPDRQPEEVRRLLERIPSMPFRVVAARGQPVVIPERGVVLVYGADQVAPKPSAVAFIPETKLYETRQPRHQGPGNSRPTLVFKGEDAIFTELRFLTEDRKKPRIYFTQDNGEPNLADLGALRDELVRNMFSVAGLRLRVPGPGIKSDERITVAKDVPADAEIVVVVNPVEPFTETALTALRQYMARKGKLLALIDLDRRTRLKVVAPKTGLEKILADFDVEVEPAYLLRDNSADKRQDPRLVFAMPAQDSTNPIALAMPKKALPLGPARPVRSLGRSRNFRVEPILEVPVSQGDYWKEDNLLTLINPDAALAKKLRDKVKPLAHPVNVAVAVKDTRDDTARMVVCGNMAMALNFFIRLSDLSYYDFLENCLQWLRGRGDKLGIKPIESGRYTLDPEAINLARMRYLPMWLIGVAIVALGAGIWVVRRR